MANWHKIQINNDPEQARRSREWQSDKAKKKQSRRIAQQAAQAKQVEQAIASGVKVQTIAPNISGRKPRERVRDYQSELADAKREITRLEAIIAKIQSWSKHDFYDSPEWYKVRYEALKRTNGCCECCGTSKADGAIIQVDHIKPRSKFPHLELDPANLQVLCKPCNLGKSNRDSIDWRKPVLKVVSGN